MRNRSKFSPWSYGRSDLRLNSLSYCVTNRFGTVESTERGVMAGGTSRVKEPTSRRFSMKEIAAEDIVRV